MYEEFYYCSVYNDYSIKKSEYSPSKTEFHLLFESPGNDKVRSVNSEEVRDRIWGK